MDKFDTPLPESLKGITNSISSLKKEDLMQCAVILLKEHDEHKVLDDTDDFRNENIDKNMTELVVKKQKFDQKQTDKA